MTDIEKIRAWIKDFVSESTGDGIPLNFQVDFTNEIPQNAGLFPTGTMEVRRSEDVLGNITVTNQYNFSLYAVFVKPNDVDEISTKNAVWAMDFQRWVQEQSIKKLAPTFGNIDTHEETIRAQNGMFYGSKEDGAAGIYMITITATFKNYYEVN